MRVLAIFAFSFAGAVLAANYWLPESVLILLGLLMALPGGLACVLLKDRRRLRKAAALVCGGLALGLLWTAAYTALFFQPARALDDRTLRLTATVADWPQETEYGYSVLVRAETDSFAALNTILYTDEQGAALRPGDRIAGVVHCTLGDRTFAGEEITYYTAKGIFLRGELYGRLEVQRPDHVPVRHWPALLSRAIKEGIDAGFPPDAAPLVRALVTGNRDNLTDEFTTSLQRTGLSHTVAVSGMHLAFLTGLLGLMLGRGKRSTALACVVWVVLFCGVAGSTPSVLRAAVMLLMLEIAPLLNRERDSFTALAFALFLLLLWNPFSAAHVGLQLSFGAVAGILLTSDGMHKWLLTKLRLDRRPKNWFLRQLIRIPRFFAATLTATLGASVLTVPLVALHFGTFSLIAPLSNLLTLWAVALLFLGGMFLGLLGIFAPGVGAVLALSFTGLARYLNWIVEELARTPLASISMESPYYRIWIVFFSLLVGLTLAMKGKKNYWYPVAAGAGTLIVALLLTALTFRAGELTAAVLDVGQGQSVLLRAGNYLTLVDCGGDGPDNAGDVAADYIQSQGLSRLDLLVVSHYHADHANGIPQLLKRVPVSAIVLPDVEEDDPLRREILALAEEREIELWFIREDTHLYLGEEQTFTIFPPVGQEGDTNELGLTVLATAGEFDVLLTGDMSGEMEKLLLTQKELPDVELLVAGHHGSRTSTTAELLAAVRPELSVISAGAGNRYGHPAGETLERLAVAGADIYRTDLHGTVVIHSKDHNDND